MKPDVALRLTWERRDERYAILKTELPDTMIDAVRHWRTLEATEVRSPDLHREAARWTPPPRWRHR